MVLDGGSSMAATLASLVMNGVCCASYSGCNFYEEEERRKAEQREFLRQSVKVEWQRHRLMEKEQELEEQRRQEDAQFLSEQRRRLLMETKRRAVVGGTETESSFSDEEHYMQRWQRVEGVRYGSKQMDGRIQSAPVVGARRSMARHYSARDVQRCPSNTSSLLDQETDSSDDDFEDVKLT